MAFEQKDMSGALFVNDKGGNDKRPDYRGDVVIGGRKWSLSGWKRVSQGGKVYLSLKVSEPQQAQTQRTQPDPIAAKAERDFDGQQINPDDIPF